jgi:hypothetical protein
MRVVVVGREFGASSRGRGLPGRSLAELAIFFPHLLLLDHERRVLQAV